MNFDKFLADNSDPDVIYLFGEEDFLIEDAIGRIFNKFEIDKVNSYTFETIDAENSDLDSIILNALSIPMMTDRKTLYIKNFDKLFAGRSSKKSKSFKPLENYLNNPPSYTRLILNGAPEAFCTDFVKAKKSQKAMNDYLTKLKFPFDLLLNKKIWFEFSMTSQSEFNDWIDKRFKELGYSVKQDLKGYLVFNSNDSIRQVDSEILKITTFFADKKSLSLNDIYQIIGENKQYNEYELQRAVIDKNLNKSLMILRMILSTSNREMEILSTITRFFIAMFKLYDLPDKSNNFTIAPKIGVSPYFVPDYLKGLQRYSIEQVEKAILLFCELEEAMKSSGTINSKSELEKLLIKIME